MIQFGQLAPEEINGKFRENLIFSYCIYKPQNRDKTKPGHYT